MIATVAQDRFYFWHGYWDAMRLLTDEDAGRLAKALCQYAFEGTEPDLSDSPMLRLAWTMVADQVRESVEIGRKQAQGGRNSGRSRRAGKKREVTSEHTSEVTSEVSSNVRYSNVPSGCAPSLEARALAAKEGGESIAEQDGPPMTEEEVDERLAELGLV